jgi:ribosomal protein L2
MIGRYLYRIAKEEAEAGRPPLTSVVVRKGSGMPGEGFLEAMAMIGYVAAVDGNDEQEVWERAVRETHEYWRPKLRDDLK